MKIELLKKGWSIDAVCRRKGRINLNPQYQRTPVWNQRKKQLLIDSILRGYDLPKFYLRSSDSKYEHEVVDGQQRLRAIWDFYDDQYALGDESRNIPDFGDLSGRKWSKLSSPQQDRIGNFRLSVVVIEEASESEIRQLFQRLQEGVTLNPAERRNAMEGKMRDFIENLGENQRVFSLTDISDTRFAWHDLAAIVTCLEMAEGPTDVKAPSLRKMYNTNQDFKGNGPIARKIRNHLAYMARVLKDQPPEMDIKWGFVDLYLLISQMDGSYVIKNREADFTNFYTTFEKERRSAMRDYGALRSSSGRWAEDLYYYIEAFIRSGGTKENIRQRHRVYKRRFLRDVQGLEPIDPQRAFTRDERIVIWRRDNGTCQSPECGKQIAFNEMEADHIIPHSRGGQTTIDNGRALCRQCNARKGAT